MVDYSRLHSAKAYAGFCCILMESTPCAHYIAAYESALDQWRDAREAIGAAYESDMTARDIAAYRIT